jgi:hypothetical protein
LPPGIEGGQLSKVPHFAIGVTYGLACGKEFVILQEKSSISGAKIINYF